MNKRTALDVVNNFLGYPIVIKMNSGRVMIRDASKLFEKGEVAINGTKCFEPEQEVKSNDYIKFGQVRYGKKNHLIVA